MTRLISSVIQTAATVDATRLAILFVGLIALGAIWLAALVVRFAGKKR